MKETALGLLVSALVLLPGNGAAQKVIPDVPYVPTPEDVVREMLEMARVGEEDVVYDLGCGDGRIVIMAARDFGAYGIGIDIDPERIRESEINAGEAGVSDRVRFLEGDMFEADISHATVVTLYLLTNMNMKLRPKLLRELKPGTRVVSHNYGMRDWKPDDYAEFPGRRDTHKVYCWTVPANVTGTWRWTQPSGFGKLACEMNIVQRFQHAEGSVAFGGHVFPIECLKLRGDRLSFALDCSVRGIGEKVLFHGKVSGNVIKGRLRRAAGRSQIEHLWHAVRDPVTISRIDR